MRNEKILLAILLAFLAFSIGLAWYVSSSATNSLSI